MTTRFTDKQGQYLSFIYYYTKVNGRPPAEADIQRYFAVTPPSVRQMVLTLESKGLIERTPGLGRSI
jgi:repressor LexA